MRKNPNHNFDKYFFHSIVRIIVVFGFICVHDKFQFISVFLDDMNDSYSLRPHICTYILIFDYILCIYAAESLGLPYLSAYLNSVGSNFSHGANFATAGSS
ncbi:hypothetical protein RND81_10G033100 [Saponaria officinalis]|uniref:Uncharacterized protein n=1 Tax=Saponaria officinalis TaxID=3572 RepID=A0AAW1HYN7_SAPOF